MLNKVTLIGRLGKDPEIRALQDGRSIAHLNLATSESWRDKATGERKEKTEWHRVVIFNENLVNVVRNYAYKGSKIYIEGQLQTRKYTDQHNIERYQTEIVLQGFGGTLLLLDSKESGEQSEASSGQTQRTQPSPAAQATAYQRPIPADLDDEIPF